MGKDQKKNVVKPDSKTRQDQSSRERSDQRGKKQNQQLTKEDLPDSTNESRGNMGSGQRQDSN